MSVDKRLYRAQNSLVGGVCAGIADYFEVDAIVVRILTVILALVTVGLAGLAYVVMWLAIPKKPVQATYYDVSPDHVQSETYGSLDGRFEGHASYQSAVTNDAVFANRQGVGHLPPQPPAGVRQSEASMPPQHPVGEWTDHSGETLSPVSEWHGEEPISSQPSADVWQK